MRTISEQSRRNARQALWTGSTSDPQAAAAIFAETGVDLSKKRPTAPTMDGKGLLGLVLFAVIALLAAPFYMASRGLWMDEPALQPHNADGDLLIGFLFFALTCLGFLLTVSRRVHPLVGFVGAGTVLAFGILQTDGSWGMTAFLVAELAFLAAYARHRRKLARGKEKTWKQVRDWSVLVICALVLMAIPLDPHGETAGAVLADAAGQLKAILTTGYMTRAAEIAAPFELPARAAAVGIPTVLAVIYFPLVWAYSRIMRWD
ncbi:MAG: hypothetical protein R3B98_08140 [Hyphomonas sp.]